MHNLEMFIRSSNDILLHEKVPNEQDFFGFWKKLEEKPLYGNRQEFYSEWLSICSSRLFQFPQMVFI